MKRARVDLEALSKRVEAWRQEREHARVPVPEALWSAAVTVAHREGVHATAKAVRFDYYGLKARMDAGASERGEPSEAHAPRFVEVEIPSLDAGGSKGETVVELVGRHGDRMRIVVAAGAVDVVALAQAFWSRAS